MNTHGLNYLQQQQLVRIFKAMPNDMRVELAMTPYSARTTLAWMRRLLVKGFIEQEINGLIGPEEEK